MVNKKIQLDFTEEGLREKIEVVQGDTGRVLICNIIGVDMTNVSARFYAVKNSGKEIYNNCTVSQNTVTIELTEQTLAEVGIVKCQLDLRKGDQKVQSFIFDIDVTASLMAQSEYLSSDEYKVVDDLADKVEKNENKIAELDDKKANKDDYGSPLKAKTVAEMTDKKKVYVYVGTETGYINGNWYTWEETAWVSGGVYNSAAIQTDKTLTQSDKAADSAIVGQQIGELKESLKDINVDTDKTLKIENKAADAKITGEKIETLDNSKISKPVKDGQPSNGTDGQILQTNGDGTVKWHDFTTTKELNTLSSETVYDMYKTDGLIKGNFVENIPIESENGKTYFTPFLDPNDYNNIFVDVEYGSPFIRFYDENKQFVSGIYRGKCYISKVIPSNAKYFVLERNTDNYYRSYYRLVQQSYEKIKKFAYSSKNEMEISNIECLTVGLEKGEAPSGGKSDKIYVIPNETYSLICVYTSGLLEEYDIHDNKIKSVEPDTSGITDYIASENAYYIKLLSYHGAYIALKGKIKKDILTIPNLYLLPENINDSVADKIKESLKLNQWFKKDAIAFGTSITYYSDKNNNVGYIELLSKELELNSYINCGADGQAVASGTRNGDGIVSKILSTDISTYDLVTMEVGTNDFRLDVPLGNLGGIGDAEFDTTTFYGALRKSIEYIRENNKTCQILICTPLQRDNSGYDVNFANSKGLKLINYVNAIENIAEMYSLNLVDLYRRSGITKSNLDTVTTDGLHPNNIGYKMIFSSMVGKIKNIYPIN